MTPLNFSHTALGVTNSNLTGAPWLVADYRQLTLSIETQTNTASRFTVIGTNDDGMQTALGTPSQTVPSDGWSIVTTVTAQGLYGFDILGFKWVNIFRPSASSATCVFNGRT
jgi:hypothetical protein